MAIITRKTTMEVANALHEGNRRFDFVPTHIGLRAGSVIRYIVMYKLKEVPHPIQSDRFRVIYVLNNDPRVHVGMSLVGLEKIEPDFE